MSEDEDERAPGGAGGLVLETSIQCVARCRWRAPWNV